MAIVQSLITAKSKPPATKRAKKAVSSRFLEKDKAAPISFPKAKRSPQVVSVTKQDSILSLLSRPEGTTIEDIMQVTDWQRHSVRGFLAGTVKKKLGLSLTSSKVEGENRRYRIATRRGR